MRGAKIEPLGRVSNQTVWISSPLPPGEKPLRTLTVELGWARWATMEMLRLHRQGSRLVDSDAELRKEPSLIDPFLA